MWSPVDRSIATRLKFAERLTLIRRDTRSRPLMLADIVANFLAFAGDRTQAMLYEAQIED
jgi:hypothetical protein